jgi:hypothetical protein
VEEGEPLGERERFYARGWIAADCGGLGESDSEDPRRARGRNPSGQS